MILVHTTISITNSYTDEIYILYTLAFKKMPMHDSQHEIYNIYQSPRTLMEAQAERFILFLHYGAWFSPLGPDFPPNLIGTRNSNSPDSGPEKKPLRIFPNLKIWLGPNNSHFSYRAWIKATSITKHID
jgi:hypothetical protein